MTKAAGTPKGKKRHKNMEQVERARALVPSTSRVHSVRWTAEEWKQIQARAKALSKEWPLPASEVDVIRIAVRAYINGQTRRREELEGGGAIEFGGEK